MNDNEAIETTTFHYYDGYRDKSRDRLEKAFSLEIANMMGYIKNEKGKLGFFSMSMKDAIDQWTAPDYEPFECTEGVIMDLQVFGNVGATVLFNFGGKYLESLQLAKTDGVWKIVHKFIVNS
jgi:hypothetical protein